MRWQSQRGEERRGQRTIAIDGHGEVRGDDAVDCNEAAGKSALDDGSGGHGSDEGSSSDGSDDGNGEGDGNGRGDG